MRRPPVPSAGCARSVPPRSPPRARPPPRVPAAAPWRRRTPAACRRRAGPARRPEHVRAEESAAGINTSAHNPSAARRPSRSPSTTWSAANARIPAHAHGLTSLPYWKAPSVSSAKVNGAVTPPGRARPSPSSGPAAASPTAPAAPAGRVPPAARAAPGHCPRQRQRRGRRTACSEETSAVSATTAACDAPRGGREPSCRRQRAGDGGVTDQVAEEAAQDARQPPAEQRGSGPGLRHPARRYGYRRGRRPSRGRWERGQALAVVGPESCGDDMETGGPGIRPRCHHVISPSGTTHEGRPGRRLEVRRGAQRPPPTG